MSAANDNTIELGYGDTLTIDPSILSVLNKTTITFGIGGGTFIANSGNSLVNLSVVTINNYDPTVDVIELVNDKDVISNYTIAGSGSSRTITLYDSSGKVISNFTLNLANGVDRTVGQYNVDRSTTDPLSITYSYSSRSY